MAACFRDFFNRLIMKVKVKRSKDRMVPVPLEVLIDPNLNYKEKGFFCRLFCIEDGEEIDHDELLEGMVELVDGNDCINRLKELGYWQKYFDSDFEFDKEAYLKRMREKPDDYSF